MRFIELFTVSDKKIYIKHKEIIEIYEKQLCVSFNESEKRSLPKNKSKLFILNVNFEIQEYNEFNIQLLDRYFSSRTSNKRKYFVIFYI